ncbi:MAG: hypothetical protein M3R13_06490 [Armatimonadota bacterium]|nr:hypothetical protein [Armatimonadota bacterium]
MIVALAAIALTQQGSFFARTFPNPTGNNGWEEYLMAADIARIRNSTSLLMGNAELSRLKNDQALVRELKRALDLVRIGNRKPLSYPFTYADFSIGPFVELAQIKQLGQALVAEALVKSADGEPKAATRAISDAFVLSRRIAVGPRTSGMVSIAMQAIALSALSMNLNRLDEESLETLAELFGKTALEPSPMIEMYFQEFEEWSRIVPDMLSQPEEFAMVDQVPPAVLNLKAAEIEAVTQKVLVAMKTIRESARAMFSRQERFWLEPKREHEDAAVAFVLDNLPGAFIHIIVRNLTQLRLAEVHCRLMLYKRRSNNYPARLFDLGDERLAYDRTTGGPYYYARLSDQSYTLYSLGTSETGRIDLIYRPERDGN